MLRVTPVTGVLIVTMQLAFFPPSWVVAVMRTLVTPPSGTAAVTMPVWSTATTSGLLENHVTFLFVALAGATVAVR